MHKKTVIAILAVILLVNLCGCSEPALYSSERLQVEIKGEGTKTLTVTLMGPVNSLYPSNIQVPEGDDAIYTVKKQKTGEDFIKLKISGQTEGMAPLIVSYLDGDTYALANITIAVDEKNKLSGRDVIVFGEDAFLPISEDAPQGSTISAYESSSRLISLTSEDGAWVVEKYNPEILGVENYGLADDGSAYEFLVCAVSNGSSTLSLVNRNMKKRISMDFEVSTLVDGGGGNLILTLLDSVTTLYDETESEEYLAKADEIMKTVRAFSPDVFVPASANLIGAGVEEGVLDISMKLDKNELAYLAQKNASLKSELALFKAEFPDAMTDSFESSGINVTVLQIDDYGAALWEKDGMLYELYIFDETDIIKAGDVVEAFLGDAAL